MLRCYFYEALSNFQEVNFKKHLVMKIRSLLSLAACLLLCFSNCGDTQTQTTEKFEDLGKEEKFKEAHDIPIKIAYEAEGEMVNFPTADGKTGSAYHIGETKNNKVLFLIHEWWGLNDFIKREADRLSDSLTDVTVFALDLYDGNIATNPEDASTFMAEAKEERLNAIIKGAMEKVGKEAKIATMGWCFGGGWSLKAGILAGSQGAGSIIYYGMPVKNAADLEPIQADILGIFALKDAWITPKVVTDFDALCKATGKNFDPHLFNADHAFANPSSEKYVETAATEANEVALTFLREKLNGK